MGGKLVEEVRVESSEVLAESELHPLSVGSQLIGAILFDVLLVE